MGTLLPPPGEPKPLAEGEYIPPAPPNVVGFNFQGIDPPSPLYIQRDDVLTIYGFTVVDGEILHITVRLLPAEPTVGGQPAPAGGEASIPKGEPGSTPIKILRYDLAFPTIPGLNAVRIPMSEGYLLGVGVYAEMADSRGQTFVRGYFQRAFAAPYWPELAIPLFSDYVTIRQPSGWPYGRSLDPTDGQGFLRAVPIANPAAGADWSAAVPTPYSWRLISASALLTTAAGGGNRTVRGLLQDGLLNILWQGCAQTVHAGGLAVQYSFGCVGYSVPAVVTTGYVALPCGVNLPAGFRFGVSTAGLAAGDQWSNIYLLVEQWIDGA
jgi:hypothetical protein